MTEQEVINSIALDTTRLWATQAQVLVQGPVAMIIFREHANVSNADAPEEKSITVAKNVASIILPTAVAAELGQLLVKSFPSAEEQKGKKD